MQHSGCTTRAWRGNLNEKKATEKFRFSFKSIPSQPFVVIWSHYWPPGHLQVLSFLFERSILKQNQVTNGVQILITEKNIHVTLWTSCVCWVCVCVCVCAFACVPETFSYQCLNKIDNKMSLTLPHKSVLSVATITISVLSLTRMPLSAIAEYVQGSWQSGLPVSQSSSVI